MNKNKDITSNLLASNRWLKENRTNCPPITLNDVISRLNKGNFLGTENSKTIKGNKDGFLTGILYLAPHKITGFNLCIMAKTCIKDCLFNAGRGKFNSVTRSRIIKTLCFLLNKDIFIYHIENDIFRLNKRAIKLNYHLTIRLNGTSDVNVSKVFKNVILNNPNIQFYDYTKVYHYIKNNTFANYNLTFSYDGTNLDNCIKSLENNTNVSIVFKNKLPPTYKGFNVIDGDVNDLRFLDNKGIIVGLKYKSSAKVQDEIFVLN